MSSYVDALKRWRLQEQRRILAETQEPSASQTAASQFDRLHERLLIAAGGEVLRVVAFAGVGGREGVGRVVLGYAEHLVQESLRVLVVLADAHVLRPASSVQVEDLVKLVHDGATATMGTDPAMHVVGLPSRYLHAAQLLSGPGFRQWLANQSKVFDRIVIEAPPVLKYAEAATLAKLAEGIVLVVRAGSTQTADVAQARQELARAEVRLLGAVLSDVQAPPSLLRRILMPETVTNRGAPADPAA